MCARAATQQAGTAAISADTEALNERVLPQSIEAFTEDWQLSQFWYSAETVATLARELIALGRERAAARGAADCRLACVCAPSVYVALRAMLADAPGGVRAAVFEIDERFALYGDEYARYDYTQPHEVAVHWRGAFDAILIDPPFLSEECLARVAETVALLKREPDVPVILCSGAVMAEHAERLLGLRVIAYRPQHARNLSNPFHCFISYADSSRLDAAPEGLPQ